MDKIETRIIKKEERKHIFICDLCKKNLGESIECEDGYYEEKGEYEQSCYVNNKAWYKLHLNLCDECKETYDYKIIKALKELGFRKD